MPINQASLTQAVLTGLISGGMLGPATPKLALGVAGGLMRWIPLLIVQTKDVGSAGAGTSSTPFSIAPSILVSNLLLEYAQNGQLGPMAPLEAMGLGNGLAAGFAQGTLQANHPGCGSGTALAKVIGPPAYSSLVKGFESAGITGQGAPKKAKAISNALRTALQVFEAPVVIAGPPSPSPGGGSGIGVLR